MNDGHSQVGVPVLTDEKILFNLQEMPATGDIEEGDYGVGLPEAWSNLLTEEFEHGRSFSIYS